MIPTVHLLYHGRQFTPPPIYVDVPSGRLASTPGDNLGEFSGRIAYDSFFNKTARSTPEYHAHIRETKHNCYDENTEVLTADGWKRWPHVTSNDRFATLDADGNIVYQTATQLITQEYSGRMYRVESQHVDLLVTPSHRMYVCGTTDKLGRERERYAFVHAEELGQTTHVYKKDGNWVGQVDVPVAVAALLGFAIGDGYIAPGGAGVALNLRVERKIRWLLTTAASAGWQVNANKCGYRLCVPSEWRSLFSQVYTETREKQIPPSVLTEWSRVALDGLFDGLMQSDGHRGRTYNCFFTTSSVLADQFQQLCLHVGLAGNVKRRSTVNRFNPDRPAKDLYKIGVVRRSLRPEVNRTGKTTTGSTYWIDVWSGPVYCATVPNGTLYVRRNGKPVWCGNSVYAHAVETVEVQVNGTPGTSSPRYWEGWTATLLALHDRPGVWVTAADTWSGYLRFAVSLRAVLEWREHGVVDLGLGRGRDAAAYLHTQLLTLLTPHYPLTLAGAPAPAEPPEVPRMEGLRCKLVAPQYAQEKWASLYLAGVSRDLLQELVRHHWQTNPSVRSTRYCDESDSAQIMHPAAVDRSVTLTNAILNTYDQAKETYRMIFDHLTAAGVDKKQARGAARNVLPGATETRLVYSLSEFQAKHILGLRLAQSTGSADAEIHRLAARMKEVLSRVFNLD